MLKSNREQKRILAEFFANLTVAWLAAVVIAPIFSDQKNSIDVLPIALLGLFISILFLYGSMFIAGKIK